MSGSKWFSCLWRGGVCVCVCVCTHLPHAAKQCTALSHPPLLHWASRSATGGNWVLSGPFLSLCTAPAERTAQSPGPQQSCFGSYDISFSSLFSQGFWFVNCLLQMSPMTQAAATNVLACVSSGQRLPPWITLPPVEQRQGFGARLPGRHHTGQNKWLKFLCTRSAVLRPAQEVQGITVTATTERGGAEWVWGESNTRNLIVLTGIQLFSWVNAFMVSATSN